MMNKLLDLNVVQKFNNVVWNDTDVDDIDKWIFEWFFKHENEKEVQTKMLEYMHNIHIITSICHNETYSKFFMNIFYKQSHDNLNFKSLMNLYNIVHRPPVNKLKGNVLIDEQIMNPSIISPVPINKRKRKELLEDGEIIEQQQGDEMTNKKMRIDDYNMCSKNLFITTENISPSLNTTNYFNNDLQKILFFNMLQSDQSDIKFSDIIYEHIHNHRQQWIDSNYRYIVCPLCTIMEIVPLEHFQKEWSCKRCGFIILNPADTDAGDTEEMSTDDNTPCLTTSPSPTAAPYTTKQGGGSTTGGDESDGDGRTSSFMRSLVKNADNAMKVNVAINYDYKTKQEYTYDGSKNFVKNDKCKNNFQHYIREFRIPNLSVNATTLKIVVDKIKKQNNNREYTSVKEVPLKRIRSLYKKDKKMNKFICTYFPTIVWNVCRVKPPSLSNEMFEQFMQEYQLICDAFPICCQKNITTRHTMLRNHYLFQRMCINHNMLEFEPFFQTIDSKKSLEDHAKIYEWCCNYKNISIKEDVVCYED